MAELSDENQPQQAQAALQLAQERLASLGMEIDSWLWETDKNHQFTFFTDNITRLTGLKEKDLLGTSRLEMALARQEPHWRAHAADLQKLRPFKNFRYVRLSVEGYERHLVVSGWPMFDERGVFLGYRGTGRDETVQVEAAHRQVEKEENLLAEIERQRGNLETVLQNLSQSVMWFDKFGIIRLKNSQTAKLLGFDPGEYDGVFSLKQHLTLMAERGDFGDVDVEEEVYTRQKRLLSPELQQQTYRIHLKSSDRFLDVGLTPLPDGSRILTHTDVTVEARKDRDLSEREALLDSLVNNIDYGTLLLNHHQRVELANKKFRQLMKVDASFLASGPTMGEVLDQMYENQCTGFVDGNPSQWPAYRASVQAQIKQGKFKAAERVRQDGKTILSSCISLPGGKRLVTYFDVTEHKDREAQLQAMQHDLAQANELLEHRVEQRTRELRQTQNMLVKKERQALLGDLVASLCHELRNPLNALNTSLYLVRRNVEKDFPKLSRAFDRSERTIERCTNILTDLYDYALVDALRKQPVEIKPWLTKVVEQVKVPKVFNVRLDIDDDLPTCDIDEKQLGSAVAKVITNAAQAIADSHNPTANPYIDIYAGDCGDCIEFIISDNGPGMDEETFAKAAEPLFSTRGFGVGLGLPIAQQIISRHGGELRLETQQGAGTTVTMWLPVSRPPVKQAA